MTRVKARWSGLLCAVVVLALVPAGAMAQGVMFVVNNRVGIHTNNPNFDLHVNKSTGKSFVTAENTGGATDSVAVLRAASDSATVNFGSHGSARTISRFGKTLGGWAEFLQFNGNGLIVGTTAGPLVLGTASVNRMEFASGGNIGIGTAPTGNPIEHSTGATLSPGGAWTNASSLQYKQAVRPLDTEEALAAFEALEPVSFRYKLDPDEGQLGFIAEDVPELVATGDRRGLSSMDIVAVLTKVVQEQNRVIARLSERVEQLEGEAAAN